MAYIDESEDMDNSSEESCEDGGDIDSCAKWNKPRPKGNKSAARRNFITTTTKKIKKEYGKIKKKLKPKMEDDERPREIPEEDQSHRNVRFL